MAVQCSWPLLLLVLWPLARQPVLPVLTFWLHWTTSIKFLVPPACIHIFYCIIFSLYSFKLLNQLQCWAVFGKKVLRMYQFSLSHRRKSFSFLARIWSDHHANMFSIHVALTKDNSHLLNSFCVMKMIALPFLKSFFKTDLSVYSFFAVFLKQLMIKCVNALKKQQFFFKKWLNQVVLNCQQMMLYVCHYSLHPLHTKNC